MGNEKAILRTNLKQARLALSSYEVSNRSAAICERLIESINWHDFGSVHVFQPIIRLHEVDTAELIRFLRAGFPGIRLFTSRKQGDAWEIVSLGASGRGQHGFDAVIVPMLGFDVSLQRIGYGGGYYDRLLTAHHRTAKIGVCYEAGRVARIPVEPHDVPMDLIVTERAIYR